MFFQHGKNSSKPILQKYDTVLSNPPFGIKGSLYAEITSDIQNEYIPIKSSNAVSLLLQAIIHTLKTNGKCAIVLPDGQDIFSKSDTTLVAIKEHLARTIYLPSGVLHYTSIKTWK